MKVSAFPCCILVLVILVGGCSRSHSVVVVLQSVTSPQSGLIADLLKVDTGGGVFGDIYYVVRIRSNRDAVNMSSETDQESFVGKSPDLPHPAKIALRWANAAQLDIFYYKVDIYQFKSVWHNERTTTLSPDADRFVELVPHRVETEGQWASIYSK